MRTLKRVLPAIGATLALLLLALGYFLFIHRAVMTGIPTESGGTCALTEGDTEETVVGRCGKPCGTGQVPKGPCHPRPVSPARSLDLCGIRCDIYARTAVCYGNEGIVYFNTLTPPGTWNLKACEWR